jgi:hypothetical protein
MAVMADAYKALFEGPVHSRADIWKTWKMKGFPMFALKPYAECRADRGNEAFSVEEMGPCRLQYHAQITDVVIVRYYHNDVDDEDGSNVELLGMKRPDDILFYCADVTKMTVSVLSKDSVMFQNKILVMKPGVFKLLDCSDRLAAWARSLVIDVMQMFSQSPRTIVPSRQHSLSSSSAPLFSPRNQSHDSRRSDASDSDDDNSGDDNSAHEFDSSFSDYLILQTKAKDSAMYPWLLRVRIKSCTPEKIGYLCSTCIGGNEKGVWSTVPCFSEKKQRKQRHARSGQHLLHTSALAMIA